MNPVKGSNPNGWPIKVIHQLDNFDRLNFKTKVALVINQIADLMVLSCVDCLNKATRNGLIKSLNFYFRSISLV